MVFSEQLSKLRKEANLTQEELAEKCDVSRQTGYSNLKKIGMEVQVFWEQTM